jgi:ectoine hydroxylase-related dioxygenase (phytanoyl-CoA dioxygenase family)
MNDPQAISRFFLTNGYWRSDRNLDPTLLARMSDLIDYHLESGLPPCRVNSDGEVCRIDALLERDTIFLEALRSDPIRSILQVILGSAVEVARHRHNHATRNGASDIPFRLHRDVQQWSQPLVSVFIYLEDSRVDNGCTTIVPASHHLPYAGPQSGGGGGNWADEHDEYDHILDQSLPVEVAAGGVLFLNSLCFHSVGVNRSAGTRKSMVFACRSCDELTRSTGADYELLFGAPRYLANEVLEVSGSLQRVHAPDSRRQSV